MGQAAEPIRMTARDLLDRDAAQTRRHEFVGGEVFAVAGAGEAHVTAALNVAMALRQHLAGTPCPLLHHRQEAARRGGLRPRRQVRRLPHAAQPA